MTALELLDGIDADVDRMVDWFVGMVTMLEDDLHPNPNSELVATRVVAALERIKGLDNLLQRARAAKARLTLS
jgi:hypothetical protein